MSTHAAAHQRPSLWPFFWALFIPIIGFILGIVEAAKHSAGRGAAIMALSIFGFLFFLPAIIIVMLGG